MLAGAANFHIAGIYDGIKFSAQKVILGSMTTALETVPLDGWYRFDGEPWLEGIKKRIQDQKNHPSSDKAFWKSVEGKSGYPYSFLPTPLESCSPGTPCSIDINIGFTEDLIDIMDQSYSTSEQDL